MRIFTRMFEMFDLVALQEIRDANLSGPNKFFNDYLNINNEWEVIYSAADGSYQGSGTETNKENTAYFYRKSKISVNKSFTMQDFEDQIFVRGPYIAEFTRLEVGARVPTFTMAQIHASASKLAYTEGESLAELYDVLTSGGFMPSNAASESDKLVNIPTPADTYNQNMIILGDLNFGDFYLGGGIYNYKFKTDERWTTVIPDDADTNLSASSAQAYDRIFITGPDLMDSYCDGNTVTAALTESEVATADSGVFRFTTFYNEEVAVSSDVSGDGLDSLDNVSDHWAVFTTIY